jgi:hypothetical protein
MRYRTQITQFGAGQAKALDQTDANPLIGRGATIEMNGV